MKKKNTQVKKRDYKNYVIGGLVVVLLVVVGTAIGGKKDTDKTEKADQASGGDLKIIKSELTDQAKFYPYEVNGIDMEVLAFKATDGTIRTALNTCQVCQNSGRGYYVQEGDQLICQNCGNRFRADDVELIKGGCNPVPILKENKIEDEATITISEAFLTSNVGMFQNWK